MRRILALLTVCVSLSVCAATSQLKVEITAPADGAQVGERPIVSGKVSDPNAQVWVVVHPLAVADYWVQPRLVVRRDGSWKVQIFIGQPGSVDVGKAFEIRAVANPVDELREGQILSDWPKAAAISDLIDVTRK